MFRRVIALTSILCVGLTASAQTPAPVDVEGQPLAGNVRRLLQALEFLGAPLPAADLKSLAPALEKQDPIALQQIVDNHALVLVDISPEARVKAKRGPAPARLQQVGYTPVIIKVHNDSTVTKPLNVTSPQALRPFATPGMKTKVRPEQVKDRFLDVEVYAKQPMTDKLSGLKVEYVIALIHSSQAGQREAVLSFDIGQGSQDLGFRAEVPILFDIKPAIPVRLVVSDFDGKPTTGRFIFKDRFGRIYPPRGKRLAPDFFFQDQVYRHSGDSVLLPPGELTMSFGRGPEYRIGERTIVVPEQGELSVPVKLERWVNPMDYGFYSGDHHIHAAGCAHYDSPTEGVHAPDMFLHVKGEGLNVGCNLTWGPCFDYQRQFFEPKAHKLSEPFTVLKYDIEVSGFGSQALGHVCLLNLRDQEYPGSEGTKTKGWPTWTTPLMRWAKAQGAYTGYAHSANGLTVNPKAASQRLLDALDADKDGKLSRAEADKGLLPEAFAMIDTSGDGLLSVEELMLSHTRASQQLPNLAVPEMNGIGAQEICVTTAQGLCDFISAMDTNRIPEWNCWYQIMNAGFPLKASGETDFPCISSSRVGQGRVYVQLGKIDHIDFAAWSEGLAKGRSYVSDGYAHALEFTVNGKSAGAKANLAGPANVEVKAKVAFASDPVLGTSVGATTPAGKTRLVEVIVNGQVAAKQEVPADDKTHDLSFALPIERSSWIALRHFPQLHTNPVEVIVADAPIRASRKSAQWCSAVIEQLWRVREQAIAPAERDEARRVFQWALEKYRTIAAECPPGS